MFVWGAGFWRIPCWLGTPVLRMLQGDMSWWPRWGRCWRQHACVSSSDSGHGSHLLSTPSLFRWLLKADRRTGSMCPPQASRSRGGGMNLLLFGGHRHPSLTFIHHLTNHLQRACTQVASVLHVFTGLTGWVHASLVLLHPTQSRNHKELPLELFKEFLPKMTGLCSCMYGFLWLEEVLVACVTNALKDNLASLPTLRGSPSIIVWSIGLPPQLRAEHRDHPEF